MFYVLAKVVWLLLQPSSLMVGAVAPIGARGRTWIRGATRWVLRCVASIDANAPTQGLRGCVDLRRTVRRCRSGCFCGSASRRCVGGF